MNLFRIPNLSDASHDDQAFPNSTDVDILAQGFTGQGAVSGLEVTAKAPAEMKVHVAAGGIFTSVGDTVAVAAADLIITPSGSAPRRDLVVVNTSGVLSVVVGTPKPVDIGDPSIVPLLPAVPAGSIAVAAVDVPASISAITNAEILSKTIPSLGSALLAANVVKPITYYRQVGTSPLARWYTGGFMSPTPGSSSDLFGPNMLSAAIFLNSRAGVLDRIASYVTFSDFGGSAFNHRLGIYAAISDSNLYPGALVLDTGSLALGTNGLRSFNISQALAAHKVYWLAHIHNATANNTQWQLGAGAPYPMLGVDSQLGPAGVGVHVTRTYGALPSTFPVGAVVDTSCYLIGVRYLS